MYMFVCIYTHTLFKENTMNIFMKVFRLLLLSINVNIYQSHRYVVITWISDLPIFVTIFSVKVIFETTLRSFVLKCHIFHTQGFFVVKF